ncbi:alpha/beta fold hydrolase [Aliiglaciecola sp. LCG003]|uniref:alpha/beta hydrolase family protein n=1 Tax=Aliiglaciecola sp. LCG003 TaxID=3053655 RepID=UPI0025737664|nr:alpha/beta fold hydrolase [Aliiglaciecola sp. LCG003]WJG08572.1 alpha/beta fold hydrolase [Aliiglaciecola sp. LCG003]
MSEFHSQAFSATDGFKLIGRFYPSNSGTAKGTIIIASATGVPQGFYRRFALRATQSDFNVVTFDYRGIGQSAPASLRGFDMDYRDWASKDLSGVVDELSQQGLPLYLLGHSYGGHAIGLLEPHQKVTAAYTFGTGAGWHGWMPRMEQLKVQFMWHVMAPLVTRVKGYLAWNALGMGEDLPLGVYRQWKRWCSYPYYFFQDPQYPHMKALYERIEMPIKAVNSTDDKWATPSSRQAFFTYYVNAKLQTADIHPSQMGLKSIGHMGYFHASASVLWEDVLSYFEQKGAATVG